MRRIILLLLLVGVLVAPLPDSALGQASENEEATEDLSLEPVTVTVSARALPLSTSPAAVTVITGEEIRSSGAVTVGELLKTVPGLHVSRIGGPGGRTGVSLRGGEGEATLVLYNGVPVNDLTDLQGGAFDFSRLSLDNVGQIEIVRGPVSSRFGSEALGGAINIISRRPPEAGRELTAAVQGGRFGTATAAATLRGSHADLDYSIGGAYQRVGIQVEEDESSLGSFAFTGGWTPAETASVNLHARVNRAEASYFPQNGGGPNHSVLREPAEEESTDLVVGSTVTVEADARSLYSVGFDLFHRDLDSFTPAILDGPDPGPSSQPSARSASDFTRVRLTAGGDWQPSSQLIASAGVQFRRETGESRNLYADLIPGDFGYGRNTGAFTGEVSYLGPRLVLTAGGRADKAARFKGEFSPRLGARWLIGSRGLALKTNWGEGFRLPSFYALSEPNVGNPALRPERTVGWDVGWEWNSAGERGSVAMSYFRTTYENLIDFSPQVFRLVNRDKVRSQGAELEGRTRLLEDTVLSGHLTYVNLDVEGTSENLRDRPRWRGGFSLDWKRSGKVGLNLAALWVGSRYDFQVPVPDRDRVGGYATVNLDALWRVAPDYEVFLRVENLLNAEYHEFIGFPNPGAWWRVGMRWRLGG